MIIDLKGDTLTLYVRKKISKKVSFNLRRYTEYKSQENFFKKTLPNPSTTGELASFKRNTGVHSTQNPSLSEVEIEQIGTDGSAIFIRSMYLPYLLKYSKGQILPTITI